MALYDFQVSLGAAVGALVGRECLTLPGWPRHSLRPPGGLSPRPGKRWSPWSVVDGVCCIGGGRSWASLVWPAVPRGLPGTPGTLETLSSVQFPLGEFPPSQAM